ncbi:MAG: hypothetical protein MUP76_04150, partial [Acidimicrobiia bacterium]|nr:hypothetical protein [Acidimicrobiia bacterium]
MRRWHSRRLIVVGVAVGVLAAFWLPARAATYALFYDEFNTSSFSGSDGRHRGLAECQGVGAGPRFPSPPDPLPLWIPAQLTLRDPAVLSA